MRELWQRLAERITGYCLMLLEQHPGKAIGSLAGFILGIFVVILGFWRTLVIALFIAAGFLLGKHRDEQKGFGQLLQMLFGERK